MNQLSPVTLGSKTPPRKKFRRRLLIIALLGLSVSLLLLTLAGTTASREKGLRLGSTTYTVEFDRDDSQDEWVDFNSWQEPRSSRRRLSVGLPFGLLTIESDYHPCDAIRQRLPRDVPSLIKHLASRNRFEVKVAAELLAEKRSEAVPALPAMFYAWAAVSDLRLYEEIRTIAFAAPEQSIDALVQVLSVTNSHILSYATYLLGSYKTNALRAAPALWAAFQTNEFHKAHFASAYFDITGECSEMMPTLREILQTGEWEEKRMVLRLLWTAGPEAQSALPEILNLFQSQPPSELNGYALFALSRISDDKQMVLESALAAMNTTNGAYITLPSYAIQSMANLGALGLPHLISLYKATQHHQDAGFALKNLGPPASPYLDLFRAELHSTERHRVTLACEIISALGTNSLPAIPELTALLQSKDSSIRAHAAAALIKLNHIDDAAIETLTDEFAIEGRSPWSPSLAFVELLANNEHARTITKNHLLKNPPAAKNFNDQIEAWLVATETWRMGTFAFQLESPEIRDLLRSIAPKPKLKQP